MGNHTHWPHTLLKPPGFEATKKLGELRTRVHDQRSTSTGACVALRKEKVCQHTLQIAPRAINKLSLPEGIGERPWPTPRHHTVAMRLCKWGKSVDTNIPVRYLDINILGGGLKLENDK